MIMANTNQTIITVIMMILKNVPPIKPKKDPTAAFKACFGSLRCNNSVTNTAKKGTMRIPNGGKKLPAIAPMAATRSPNLLPPNRFTK